MCTDPGMCAALPGFTPLSAAKRQWKAVLMVSAACPARSEGVASSVLSWPQWPVAGDKSVGPIVSLASGSTLVDRPFVAEEVGPVTGTEDETGAVVDPKPDDDFDGDTFRAAAEETES